MRFLVHLCRLPPLNELFVNFVSQELVCDLFLFPLVYNLDHPKQDGLKRLGHQPCAPTLVSFRQVASFGLNEFIIGLQSNKRFRQ